MKNRRAATTLSKVINNPSKMKKILNEEVIGKTENKKEDKKYDIENYEVIKFNES